MSKKPKGFKAFDSLMQKPVKVPVPVRLTVAQENVLKRLMVGWVLDHHGKNAMQGFLTRGRGETAVVSSKTMGFLLAEGLICKTTGDVTDFQITTNGKAAIK